MGDAGQGGERSSIWPVLSIRGTHHDKIAPSALETAEVRCRPNEGSEMRKLAAEFIGTFVLVFGGCGSAVFSAAFPHFGIGLLGVSLAFGLTVLGCAYGLGHVSGCHLNPAVTVGLCAAKRFQWKDLPGYVAAQLVGAIVASGLLVVLLKAGPLGYDPSVGGLAAN